MTISEYSVKRPVTVLMVTVSILVLGFISLTRLPLALEPEVPRNGLSVNTSYPSSSPEEVEFEITRPLEEVLSTLNNLDTISSTSSNNRSSIRVVFQQGTNIDLAALEVRDRIDQVRNLLPSDIERVSIHRWGDQDDPVIRFSVGWAGDREELFRFVEETLSRRLERIEGVANVDFRGVEAKQIIVDLNQEAMRTYGIDVNAISSALRNNNVNVSGGFVEDAGKKFTLRTVGEFSDVDQIGRVPLRGGTLTVSDVASIRFGFEERQRFSRLDGKESISGSVFKASTANVVSVCAAVREQLNQLEGEWPDEAMTIRIYRDGSEDILKSLNDLKTAGIFGGLLAMVVLFLFLMKFRSTLIISLAIPISVMFTLAFMYLLNVFFDAGVTLNVISLMGLMVAVGMLVDNSVVVLENIFRFKQDKGMEAKQAAILGSREVGIAVFAATATTVAVFVSFIFLQDTYAARQYRDFSITVAVSLIASLIVALTLIPMIASRIFTGKERPKQRVIVWMSDVYGRLMGGVLRFRFVALILVAVIGWWSYSFSGNLGREYRPRVQQRQLSLTVFLERSLGLPDVHNTFGNLEEMFLASRDDMDVSILSTSYDTDVSRRGRYSGSFTFYLKGEEGNLTTTQVQELIREKLPPKAGVEYQFGRRRHYGGGDMGISVRLRGDDPGLLSVYAEEVKTRLERVPELEDVQTSLETGEDEVHVKVDRTKAEKFGVTPTEVARTISSALSTRATSRYKSENGEVDIILQLKGTEDVTLDELRNSTLENRAGEQVPLYSVIDFSYEKGPLSISREDRQSQITVSANTPDGGMFMVQPLVEDALADLVVPPGYTISQGMDFFRRMQEEQDSQFAIIMAIIIMYMIMAALFESFLHPLTILFTVPFSVVGVVILFYLTGTNISSTAYLGILILFGIVVNNGIILLDHIGVLRRSGQQRNEAIVQAGKDRLRPILMTAVTSIIGLLPLTLPAMFPEIFGTIEGRSRQWAPVSMAVLGGLTTSTFLTLIILPAIYTYMDDLQRGATWLFRRIYNAGGRRSVAAEGS